MQWFPIVTMLQLAVDMAVANATPIGFGHVFAPEHYLTAWMTVAGAPGWSPEDIERLSRYLAERGR